jgi:hypothetical protein
VSQQPTARRKYSTTLRAVMALLGACITQKPGFLSLSSCPLWITYMAPGTVFAVQPVAIVARLYIHSA